LHPAIEGATTQAESVGSLADIVTETCQCLANEKRLDFFHTHIFQSRRMKPTGTCCRQSQVRRGDRAFLRHQHSTFDRMIQFAHVTWPRMLAQHLNCGAVESRQMFSISLPVHIEKVRSQWRNIVAAVPQGWKLDFDSI